MSNYYFPEAILREILLRLPIKSLGKCSAVCQSWRSLIRTFAFIHAHLSSAVQSVNQNNTDHLLLLNALAEKEDATHQVGELFSLHWDNPAFGEYTKILNPFIYHNTNYFPQKRTVLVQNNFSVVGTCNGLVCLAANFATIIWNPCVRKFMFLPRPRIAFSATDYTNLTASYAFGYGSRTDDYKVLRIVSNKNVKTPCEVEVWSLARGYWKSLSAHVIPADFSPASIAGRCTQAFVNGAPHWLQLGKNEGNCIVSFDMARESFGKIMVPDELRRRALSVSRYEESLALFERECEVSDGSNTTTCVHMWIMKEYGVAESWTKALSVCLEGSVTGPFGVRKSSEVVFRMLGGVLVSVDPKTEQVKDFETDGYRYFFMDSFVETLVLLDQPNAISY